MGAEQIREVPLWVGRDGRLRSLAGEIAPSGAVQEDAPEPEVSQNASKNLVKAVATVVALTVCLVMTLTVINVFQKTQPSIVPTRLRTTR